MKKIFLFTAIIVTTINTVCSQTYVSGGIYTNTTWTKANSPYIVTDTVVVFPGVKLTIEPGVIVKFDQNTYLEVRNGELYAVGNSNDSIRFTSNSANQNFNDWVGIILFGNAVINLDYCIIKYTTLAINATEEFSYSPIKIKRSCFSNNSRCFEGYNDSFVLWLIDSCTFTDNLDCVKNTITVKNSFFINNENGIIMNYLKAENCVFCNNNTACNFLDTIIGCIFSQNNVGLEGRCTVLQSNIFKDNNIAINYLSDITLIDNNMIYNNNIGILTYYFMPVSIGNNNSICNNIDYNVFYNGNLNIDLSNICWCETDSTAIASKIYDGYDDVQYGLVDFMPFTVCDTTQLPIVSYCSGYSTLVEEKPSEIIFTYSLYPNPFSNNAILEFDNSNNKKYELVIFDSQGKLVREMSGITENKVEIEKQDLNRGLYFFHLHNEREVVAKGKFVIE